MAIIKNISQFPFSGRIVPEYNNPNLREKIYQNYRIVYRIKNDAIEIIVIVHGMRQLGKPFYKWCEGVGAVFPGIKRIDRTGGASLFLK